MNKKAVETISVNAVRDSIVCSDFLDQYITDNDKEPSWDGSVYIYTDKSKTKDKLKGKIPVQVKGTEKDDFSKEEISFPVSTVDLRNYLNDGGAVFFVVYIGQKGLRKQIYYSELPPIKLKIYLAEAKGQKTKSIKLKKFPSDSNEKATIFFQCFENCQKQASFSNVQLLSLEELEKQGVLKGINIPVSAVGGIDPLTALLKNEVYVYAELKGSAIPQPIEMLPQKLSTEEKREAIITAGGRQFYTSISIIRDVKNITMVFGESFSIKHQNDTETFKIKYTNSDKIRTLAVDLDFIITCIEARSFQINGVNFPLDINSANFSSFNIEKEKSRLNYIKKIVLLLDTLNCKKDLSVKSLTDKDWKHLKILVTALVDRKPVNNLQVDLPTLTTIKVADLVFVICLQKLENEDNTYNIFDFFNTELLTAYENCEGEKLAISQYAILHADDLCKADNIRYDVLLPSFQNAEQHKETIIRANFFLLELIKAFDKDNSKKELLSTAKSFSNWLFESDDEILPYDVKLLNKLQIEKRERSLTFDEERELLRIVENSDTQEDVIVGAYLLLSQQVAAQIHFSKLNAQQQNEFKTYPIYHFWKSEEKENGQAQNADGE